MESLIYSEPLPQFYREYRNFIKYQGNRALLVSLFQNMYYIVESMIVVLLLGLMQRAGELWFKNNKLEKYSDWWETTIKERRHATTITFLITLRLHDWEDKDSGIAWEW